MIIVVGVAVLVRKIYDYTLAPKIAPRIVSSKGKLKQWRSNSLLYKRIKKGILIVAAVFAVCSIPILIIYFTVINFVCFNGLRVNENIALMEYYHLECDKELQKIEQDEEFIFQTTDRTTQLFDSLEIYLDYRITMGSSISTLTNEIPIFKEIEQAYSAMIEYASEEYYFSLNDEWVLNEPKQALYFYQELHPRFRSRLQITIEGLSLTEYVYYATFYDIGAGEISLLSYDGESPAPSEFDPSHETEVLIESMNDILWNDDYSEDAQLQDIRQLLATYGINEANQITVDWVMTNPLPAYQMAKQVEQSEFLDEIDILHSG